VTALGADENLIANYGEVNRQHVPINKNIFTMCIISAVSPPTRARARNKQKELRGSKNDNETSDQVICLLFAFCCWRVVRGGGAGGGNRSTISSYLSFHFREISSRELSEKLLVLYLFQEDRGYVQFFSLVRTRMSALSHKMFLASYIFIFTAPPKGGTISIMEKQNSSTDIVHFT